MGLTRSDVSDNVSKLAPIDFFKFHPAETSSDAPHNSVQTNRLGQIHCKFFVMFKV